MVLRIGQIPLTVVFALASEYIALSAFTFTVARWNRANLTDEKYQKGGIRSVL